MVFSPFVGYVDAVMECVAVDFGVGVDTLVANTTINMDKTVVVTEMVVDMARA